MADEGRPIGEARLTREMVSRGPIVPIFRTETARLTSPAPEVITDLHSLPAKPHESLTLLRAPEARAAQAFRTLRLRLVERGDPRTILITSASAGEGKSFVAANLALVLAELRRFRVLLLEANVTAPVLAERFVIPAGQHGCAVDQMNAHVAEPDAPWRMIGFDGSDLHLLAIAPSTDARALCPAGFREALERLRWRYDYLVVDGPAVDAGAYATVLHDAVQTLVLVGRAGRTRARTVRHALERLSPGQVAGVVLVDLRGGARI